MSLQMKVKCPRCGRVWTVPQGTPDILCNCHLYCSQGTKPSDCNVTDAYWAGQLGYPTGLHVNAEDLGDDVMHRVRYCSTHDEYIYKTPVLIPCDWQKWFSRRAPKALRMSHGKY